MTKNKEMRYERPELKTLYETECAIGACTGGIGDIVPRCTGGVSAGTDCSGGTGFTPAP